MATYVTWLVKCSYKNSKGKTNTDEVWIMAKSASEAVKTAINSTKGKKYDTYKAYRRSMS